MPWSAEKRLSTRPMGCEWKKERGDASTRASMDAWILEAAETQLRA